MTNFIVAEKKIHFQEKKLIGEDDVRILFRETLKKFDMEIPSDKKKFDILLLKLNLVNKNIVNESLIDFHLIMMTQKITQMTSHYCPLIIHND